MTFTIKEAINIFKNWKRAFILAKSMDLPEDQALIETNNQDKESRTRIVTALSWALMKISKVDNYQVMKVIDITTSEMIDEIGLDSRFYIEQVVEWNCIMEKITNHLLRNRYLCFKKASSEETSLDMIEVCLEISLRMYRDETNNVQESLRM